MPARLTPLEQLRYARQVIQMESRALALVAKRLDGRFCQAVECLYQCRGNVIVSGMGKAGLVGQKIMATLASTGTPSHCLHPAEAVHGDLGRIHADDVALILSQSGETAEILRLLAPLAELGLPIIAITGRADSTLGRAARVVLELGPVEEACPLGLAPSSSTTAMLAVGDALALVTSRHAEFRPRGFRPFPSGRQPGAKAQQGGAAHAAAGAVPRGPRGPDRPRGARPGPRAGAADRGHNAGGRRGQAFRHLHR